MPTDPPAVDLGALTREQRQTLVRLRYELEHARSQGYTMKPMLLADVQMALAAVDALAARLAAQQPLVEAAVALHECLRRCGPEWSERLRAVYDAAEMLNAGAVGAGEGAMGSDCGDWWRWLAASPVIGFLWLIVYAGWRLARDIR